MLGLSFDEQVHGDIFREIDGEDWDEGFVYLPRGCFKSFMLAAFCARNLAKDRNWRGLLVGATYAKTAETVSLARQFLETEMVERHFGRFRSTDSWASDAFTVSGRTKSFREPSLSAMGASSFKPGGHYDFVGVDDIEDQDTINTAELIQKTRRIDGLAYPMASEGRRQRLTFGTFWDDADLYNHKMRLFKLHDGGRDESGFETIIRKRFIRRVVEIRLPDGTFARKRVFQFWKPAVNEDGTALFPARLPLSELAILKASMPTAEYAAQYDLDPIAGENATFRKHMFRYDDRLPKEKMECFILGDFARSLRPGSDYTGFVVVFIDQNYVWYVVEAGRHKFGADSDDLIERVVNYHRTYGDAHFCFEEDGYATGIKKRMEEKLMLAHLTPRITWIKSGGRKSKNGRIASLVGQFQAGGVVLLPGCGALEEELLRHPKSAHKDVADAFANILEVAQATSPHTHWEEAEPAPDPRDADPDAPWNHGRTDDDDARYYDHLKPEDIPWEAM